MRTGLTVTAAFLAGIAMTIFFLSEPRPADDEAAGVDTSQTGASFPPPQQPDVGGRASLAPGRGTRGGGARPGGAGRAGRGGGTGEAVGLRLLAEQDFDAAVNQVLEIEDPTALMRSLRGVLNAATPEDAWSLLTLASLLPDEQAAIAREAAIRQIALTDPAGAAREVDRLSSSQERKRLSRRIIGDFATADPDAALAWARGLEPPIQGVEETVLARIGTEDPMRAIELMIESERPVTRSVSISRMVTAIMDSGATSIERLVDTVLLLPGSDETQEIVAKLTTSWAAENPAAAMNWLARQGNRCDGQAAQGQCAMITPNLFAVTAQSIGARDPAFALTYADRVPSALRADWIRATAAGYAREDPRAALDWIGSLGNDPDYGPAAVAVAENLAASDAPAAANLLSTVPRGVEMSGATFTIASTWAATDPWSAANWADQLDDDRARSVALASIVRTWSEDDLQSASSWLYSYPRGPERDNLINTAIGIGVNQGVLDGNLLGALSTDLAREQAVANAVQMMAMNGDPVTARRWIDLYVQSPATRDRLTESIERRRNQ